MTGGARRLIVAIDGPAGAGKSTLARALARALGYTYVDSGAMYRVVGLAARARGIDPADGAAVAELLDGLDFALRPAPEGQRVLLDGRDVTDELRTPAAGEWASRVAALPEVRQRLVERQRRLGEAGGVVMDGRDIGTVVFPGADCKFYVTASAAERARRRAREIGAPASDLPEIQRDIEARDRRDSERVHAPLRAAADMETIDTTGLTADEAVGRVLARVTERAKA
ncbi:MAG: (d)CMP kinase [Deltaproteobacteria bacterium]|nr:(d)CMP kinase [Deltaproteobacteria bacterium]